MSLYQVQKLIYQIHNQLDLRAQFIADPGCGDRRLQTHGSRETRFAG